MPSLWAAPGHLYHDHGPLAQGAVTWNGCTGRGWGQRMGQVGKGAQPSLPLNIWGS